ncbi:hypothetical protein INT47_002309, partial [Mucor saturninus]
SHWVLITKPSFRVVRASIINIMGKKQCESYKKYNAFTSTDLSILRSIHKLPHFNADKHNEVNHLIEPLKRAFQVGSMDQVATTIENMKNIQIYKGNPFTTIDYQLLDIIEYISNFCVRHHNLHSKPFIHWTHIFDILFRGTNIKLTKAFSLSINTLINILYFSHKSKFSITDNSDISNDTILFQCHAQQTTTDYGRQNNIELATCGMTMNMLNATQLENDDREAIFQSHSVLVNKSILEELTVSSYRINDLTEDVFPIGIQLIGYVGYLYSVKRYKGVYIASQVCESTLFIPQTLAEFQSFLYNDHILEMLCNLKRHYVNIAKVVRRASFNRGI